jgi:hypothetical protein
MFSADDPGSTCSSSFDIQSMPSSFDPINANGIK